jgi:hypothetical protein
MARIICDISGESRSKLHADVKRPSGEGLFELLRQATLLAVMFRLDQIVGKGRDQYQCAQHIPQQHDR